MNQVSMNQVSMNQASVNQASVNKHSLKKQLIATSIMLAIAATPVMASSSDIENTVESNTVSNIESDGSSEIIGFSTGAIIGGLIAGPIGIVAAGTIGLIIGQSHERHEQVEIAESRLEKNKLVMQSLNSAKQSLQSRLAENEQAQQMLTAKLALTERTLSQADTLEQIKLNIRFEVDSAHVESFYKPQINHLAMMMQDNPQMSVNLSGFSDPSGNDDSNLTLSKARAESVKLLLVNQGVNESSIFTQAFGEKSAIRISRSARSDFNNRRVDVELISQEEALISSIKKEDSFVEIKHDHLVSGAKKEAVIIDNKQEHMLADIH